MKATASTGGITSDVGPFAIVPEWLLYDERVTANAIRLYAVLGRYADTEAKAFPSRRTLAAKCDCSVDTVDRALAVLRDLGAVKVKQRRSADGDHDTNLYTVIRARPGLGTDADTPLGTDAQTGMGMGAAQNESQVEREPAEREKPSAAVATVAAYDPLKGRRIDGKDLPWDALQEVTQAYGAANGPRMRMASVTIRKVTWDWAVERNPTLPNEIGHNAAWFEKELADLIRAVARWLDQESPGLTWGPEGIARNFARALTQIERRRTTIENIVTDVERKAAL